MSGHNQRTYCYADKDNGKICGSEAVGPHPDPEIGYRFPLCRFHTEAQSRHMAERAEEDRLAELDEWPFIRPDDWSDAQRHHVYMLVHGGCEYTP